MQFKSQVCNGKNVDFFRQQKHHFQLETHHYAVGRRERTTGCTVLNIHLLTTMQWTFCRGRRPTFLRHRQTQYNMSIRRTIESITQRLDTAYAISYTD